MATYVHHIILLVFTLLIFECATQSVKEDDESFLQNPKYTKSMDVAEVFSKLMIKHPYLALVGSIGQTVKGRSLWYLQISQNVRDPHPGRPMFKYVANMHGDEAIGRELVIQLAHYLLYNYGKNDRVTRLVNSTDIFLLPSLNPDGFNRSKVSLFML